MMIGTARPGDREDIRKREWVAKGPAGLSRIVRRATTVGKNQRYQSGRELFSDIVHYGEFDEVGLSIPDAVELNFTGLSKPPAGAPSWQGSSVATWQIAGGRGRGAAPRGGSLRVVTTGTRPGYLRKNGVPYSASTTLTEYYNATNEPNGDRWLIITTIVEDPVYLNDQFVTSTHFKKVVNGSSWNPTPCEAS